MSRKIKRKDFHPGLSHYFRWLVFGIICYFSITYLSTKTNNPPLILGETTTNIESLNLKAVTNNLAEKIDPQKKMQLDQITASINTFVTNIPSFIDQQVIKFKKDIITQVYQDLIKNIEKK